MPKPEKDDHNFKNLAARWYVPRVIYFDLDSLLLPVYGRNLIRKNLAHKQLKSINIVATFSSIRIWEKISVNIWA